ncbi:Greb1-Like Protein [Manis pentadactyla]|nr:Greb1-Like Protein [Manis pentadactyla]
MESSKSSSSEKIELTEEEQVYLKQLYKMNQFYQDLSSPQYLQTYNQRQKVRYPRIHIKTNEYHLLPLQKTELTDEEKTYLKQLVKINQFYQRSTFPQYPQALHPQQVAVNGIQENTYPIIPSLV